MAASLNVKYSMCIVRIAVELLNNGKGEFLSRLHALEIQVGIRTNTSKYRWNLVGRVCICQLATLIFSNLGPLTTPSTS